MRSNALRGKEQALVIPVLDTGIQVKKGFLSHLDPRIKSEDDNKAGIPRHEAKASARDDSSFLLMGTMLSNAFMPQSTNS